MIEFDQAKDGEDADDPRQDMDENHHAHQDGADKKREFKQWIQMFLSKNEEEPALSKRVPSRIDCS